MRSHPLWIFARAWVESNTAQSTAAKIKATTIALAIGCVIAILVMSGRGVNGGLAFQNLFTDAFHPIKLNSTLIIISIFTIVGVANAVAFKAGLFNIGVSGQMFFAAVIGIIFGVQIIPSTGVAGVLLLIVICMIVGGLVAAFAGLLKALFNIHEVVATILLNWALFFFGRWLLFQVPGLVIDNGQGGTRALTSDMAFLFQVPNASYIVLGCFGLAFTVLIAFVFWKTTFGFKVKAVGLSPEAAHYAGINRRRRVVLAMGLSGLTAGLGGAIAFVLVDQNIASNFFISDLLPTWGFDGIAIALLAFNNPIGVIPIAVFLGTIKSGATSLSIIGLDSQVYDLVLGIIMYLSAIAVIFMRFRLVQMLWTYYRCRASGPLSQAKIAFLLTAQTSRGWLYARLIKYRWVQRSIGAYYARFDAQYVARRQELAAARKESAGASVSGWGLTLSRARFGKALYARWLVWRAPARLNALAELASPPPAKHKRRTNHPSYLAWRTSQLAMISAALSTHVAEWPNVRAALRSLRQTRATAIIKSQVSQVHTLAPNLSGKQVLRTSITKSVVYLPYRAPLVRKVWLQWQLYSDRNYRHQRATYQDARRTQRAALPSQHRTLFSSGLSRWQTRRAVRRGTAWQALITAERNERLALRREHQYTPRQWPLSLWHRRVARAAQALRIPYARDDRYQAYRQAAQALQRRHQAARRQLFWSASPVSPQQAAREKLRVQYSIDRQQLYNQRMSQWLSRVQPLFAPRERYIQTRRQILSKLNTEYFERTHRYAATVRSEAHERALHHYQQSPRGYARRAAYQKVVARLLARSRRDN